MKIENSSKESLELFAKKQKNLISARSAELENIEKSYDVQEQDLRSRGQEKLADLANSHQLQTAKEIEREEEYLKNFQTNLQNQKNLYEKSLIELREQNARTLNNIQTKHREDLENKFSTNLLDEKSINDRINFEKKTFHDSALEELKSAQHKEYLSVQDFKQKLDKDSEKTRNALSPTSTKAVLEQKELTRIKHEEQLNIDRQARANEVAQNQMKATHATQLQNEEKIFGQNMKTKQDLFTQKYQDTEKTQTEYLNGIKKKFETELQQITATHAEKKAIHDQKIKDSFYRISSLDPKVEEKESEYIISVPIAEHEKENVQLTAQGRRLHLGMTRRFNDQVTAEDGTKATSSRSEAISKEFSVAQIVNPKTVTQKFEDGKVIFKISKL